MTPRMVITLRSPLPMVRPVLLRARSFNASSAEGGVALCKAGSAIRGEQSVLVIRARYCSIAVARIDQEMIVLEAHKKPIQAAWWRAIQILPIDVEMPSVARAFKTVAVITEGEPAAKMCTCLVQRQPIGPVLISHPGFCCQLVAQSRSTEQEGGIASQMHQIGFGLSQIKDPPLIERGLVGQRGWKLALRSRIKQDIRRARGRRTPKDHLRPQQGQGSTNGLAQDRAPRNRLADASWSSRFTATQFHRGLKCQRG
jgi:hypothetical protein